MEEKHSTLVIMLQLWRRMDCCLFLFCITFHVLFVSGDADGYISAIGDPEMKRDELRVAIEAWNQCNEVGKEAPNMGSPRAADCFDIDKSTTPFHRVTEDDNKLGVNNASDHNVDEYAPLKEIYLGDKCQVNDNPNPWQFWMIMLKSGNMDTLAALCPENGHPSKPFPPQSRFPCFGEGCMNMPLIYHNYTSLQGNNILRGSFYGTWDLDTDISKGVIANSTSYFAVTWEKEVGKGSWIFHHLVKTSIKYPWLMLYLRSDATTGFSGGYHYQTRGMSKISVTCVKLTRVNSSVSLTHVKLTGVKLDLASKFVFKPIWRVDYKIPESPNFKVRFTLNIKRGGGTKSQFYLMDMGSCWKNSGKPCDGDVTSDVTRYSEMIINPNTDSWCRPDSLAECPPYHTLPNGTRIHRTDKKNYPYGAYHMYCAPGNAKYLEEPYNTCDEYSNPQSQEILQILPHPAWGEYGYPTKKGQGWIGDPQTWELDVGRLSQALHFYQDPGTEPVKRFWPSIDLGTEIYISSNEIAEWTVSDFDIIVPKDNKGKRSHTM
ncbi:hypothetical protein GIB67_032564 [Kingdonia uniflora]|uniref:DUF7705 domain-containing protein n=1 Tax=Kingdonia uniflora TaxID=39325 RepID=A0A7J7LS12_9MAGN|nr:hypothetical protein GIB67_032564 [Kingdonia uniflora]